MTTTVHQVTRHLCVCGHRYGTHVGSYEKACGHWRCRCRSYHYRDPQPPAPIYRGPGSKPFDTVLQWVLLGLLALIVASPLIQAILGR